jgi:hypothetical protein
MNTIIKSGINTFFIKTPAPRGLSFGQQYFLQKGLKVVGPRGKQAIKKELDQLVKRDCFTPVWIGDMSDTEWKKAMEALVFLTEKRDGTVKG